jgi:hypothetical protein
MSFENYKGYTHFPFPLFVLPLWKRIMCAKEMHLWDEVATSERNYLICDACGIQVDIQAIEKELQ